MEVYKTMNSGGTLYISKYSSLGYSQFNIIKRYSPKLMGFSEAVIPHWGTVLID